MCTGWCPPSADWGNVSEVIGTIANVVGTFALVYLAAKANRLIARANHIATEFAQQEQSRIANEQKRISRSLLRSLLPDLESTKTKTERLITYMKDKDRDVIYLYSQDPTIRAEIRSQVESFEILKPTPALSQLHLLDEHASSAIERAIHLAKSIRGDAEEAQATMLRTRMYTMLFGTMYRELRELRLELIKAIESGEADQVAPTATS